MNGTTISTEKSLDLSNHVAITNKDDNALLFNYQ